MKLATLFISAACVLTTAPIHAQSRYIYSSGSSEVTDSQTALVWRRCSEGMAWIGGTCTGVATTYSHEGALVHAKTQTGWRLPNVKELLSIVDMSRMEPAIDPSAFPATSSGWYWSSSPMVGDSSFAWVVNFNYGEAFGGSRSGRINRGGLTDYYVALRLVR
jgi:hypothetical protein